MLATSSGRRARGKSTDEALATRGRRLLKFAASRPTEGTPLPAGGFEICGLAGRMPPRRPI